MGKRKEYHNWPRVFGPDLDRGKKERARRNLETMKNKAFIEACKLVDIEPTRRQAGKWNNKKGKAYESKTSVE